MSARSPSADNSIENSKERTSLQNLPYDLLLNVAQHLEFRDVQAMQLTCRSLHDFANTRPVFRGLAAELLRRCRGLPLAGFQRLTDLTTSQLAEAVRKAAHLEHAWLSRTPRPATLPFGSDPEKSPSENSKWYKVISSPPDEYVDWLSPITSSYSLCATKSGKVVCWDVQQDVCLAEWTPKGRWELWKCRVEFDVRTVFFTMAKVIKRSLEDRLMEFVLMKLEFTDSSIDPTTGSHVDPSSPPTFHEISTFKTIGVVMNVFLLDPPSRLLCAFVWVSSSNTIGLYALLDWAKHEYVFIDTGIECSLSSNWSCILYKEQIVIHSEESDTAHQYFYPISVLAQYAKVASVSPSFVPALSARVGPTTTMSVPFIFPRQSKSLTNSTASTENTADAHEQSDTNAQSQSDGTPDANGSSSHEDDNSDTTTESSLTNNPFPFPPWYPESAHFVRQWWPTLPSVPKLSCTVVLLADHDPESHRTRYVLAQHYFKVPLLDPESLNEEARREGYNALGKGKLSEPRQDDARATYLNGTAHIAPQSSELDSGPNGSNETTISDAALCIWYVSQPFEVVCVLDGFDELNEDGTHPDRPRPLMAVDFGHAVWVEYVESDGGEHRASGGNEGDPEEPNDPKRLRFVSFPPVSTMWDDEANSSEASDASDSVGSHDRSSSRVEGAVRTLEVPDELDLSTVETINIDQSQGAVIVSVAEGKIFILYYE